MMNIVPTALIAAAATMMLGQTGCYQPRTDISDESSSNEGVSPPSETFDVDAAPPEPEPAPPAPGDPGEPGGDPGGDPGEPGGDPGEPGGSPEPDPEPPPSGITRVRVAVRTAPTGQRYSPRNVGAVWIETSDGRFVRTLELWARARLRYLVRYGRSGANTVDALTGATLRNHRTHQLVWNLGDANRDKVPPGTYRLVVEMTERNGSGPTLEIPFELGTEPFTLSPDGSSAFPEITLVGE